MILATLICSVITVAILVVSTFVKVCQSRTKFSITATDFVPDSDHEVLRIFVTITNHSSAPISISDIHFLGDMRNRKNPEMLPASWSKQYTSPATAESKHYQKLTDDQRRWLNDSKGAILLPHEFKLSGAEVTHTVPIDIPGYSSFGGYLSFQAGVNTAPVSSRLTEHTFLIVTSRGIYQKTFTPSSRKFVG